MNFLKKYFEEMCYLENKPLDINKFMSYCKKMGLKVSAEELENLEKKQLLFPIFRLNRPKLETKWIYFKKDGKSLKRPLSQGLQKDENFLEEKTESSYFRPSSFCPATHSQWLTLFKEGHILNPENEAFVAWKEYIHVDSFYSSYQVLWLAYIQQQSTLLTIGLKHMDSLSVDANGHLVISGIKNGSLIINKMTSNLNKIRQYQIKFTKLLKFLMLIQAKYHPLYQSGSDFIQATRYDQDVSKIINDICPKKAADFLEIELDIMSEFYVDFCKKADCLLGQGSNDDWLQVWKNIHWKKKNKLNGEIRFGIEYLQIATMIKNILQDLTQKQIPDIDEVHGVAPNDIFKVCDEAKSAPYRTNYSIRMNRYADEALGSFYHKKYKRRYYLANDFGYGYHPSVMLFVEGKSEEIALPIISQVFFSVELSDLSIEIVNLGGTEGFFGANLNIKNNGKYKKKAVSNFRHLISRYIETWQVMPFLITDKENDLPNQLKSGVIVEFDGKSYSFPEDWIFIWGNQLDTESIENDNPLLGNSFELANFYDDELCAAIKAVHDVEVNPQAVKKLRSEGKSLNQLDLNSIDLNKTKICKYLANGLHESDKNHHTRPVYDFLAQIIKTAHLWTRAKDRKHELENLDFILNKLNPHVL